MQQLNNTHLPETDSFIGILFYMIMVSIWLFINWLLPKSMIGFIISITADNVLTYTQIIVSIIVGAGGLLNIYSFISHKKWKNPKNKSKKIV